MKSKIGSIHKIRRRFSCFIASRPVAALEMETAIPVLPASGFHFECSYRARSDETREPASYFVDRPYLGFHSAESGLVKPMPLTSRTEKAGSRRLYGGKVFANMVTDNGQSGQWNMFKDLRWQTTGSALRSHTAPRNTPASGISQTE